MTDAEMERELAAVLGECCSPDAVLRCVFHPDRPASTACRGCGRTLCFACFSEAYPELLCPECRRERRRNSWVRTWLCSLRRPLFWVLLCIAVAAAAYAGGRGNPSASALARRDRGRPYFRQALPQRYLEQASRQNRRAEALHRLGRPEEAGRWRERAAASFAAAAERWRDTPAWAPVRIGAAMAEAQCGRIARAEAMLTELAPSRREAIHPGWLFCRARLRELAGDRDGAARLYTEALQAAGEARRQALDRVLDRIGDNTPEGPALYSIATACGAVMDLDAMLEQLRDRPEWASLIGGQSWEAGGAEPVGISLRSLLREAANARRAAEPEAADGAKSEAVPAPEPEIEFKLERR